MPAPLHRFVLPALILLLLAGCASQREKKAKSEEEVAEAFKATQDAIKATRQGDIDMIWRLLCKESKDRTLSRAGLWSKDFRSLEPERQAQLASERGLSVEQLANLTAKTYLKMIHGDFYERYFMLCEAQIDHISPVKNDQVKVFYSEDDSSQDKKSLTFVHEKESWKVLLDIP
jgi:hypothetical protein